MCQVGARANICPTKLLNSDMVILVFELVFYIHSLWWVLTIHLLCAMTSHHLRKHPVQSSFQTITHKIQLLFPLNCNRHCRYDELFDYIVCTALHTPNWMKTLLYISSVSNSPQRLKFFSSLGENFFTLYISLNYFIYTVWKS